MITKNREKESYTYTTKIITDDNDDINKKIKEMINLYENIIAWNFNKYKIRKTEVEKFTTAYIALWKYLSENIVLEDDLPIVLEDDSQVKKAGKRKTKRVKKSSKKKSRKMR